MKESVKFFLKLYFIRILPISAGIVLVTLLIMYFTGTFMLVRYLDILFYEGAACLIIAGVSGLNWVLWGREAGTMAYRPFPQQTEVMLKDRGQRVAISIYMSLVGGTIFLIMIIIHILSSV